MFDPAYPVAKLRPADYNPRVITPESQAQLRESIRAHGILRPVIATEAGLLIAGHQRTSQIRALGIETTPAFVLPPVPLGAEIRFN